MSGPSEKLYTLDNLLTSTDNRTDCPGCQKECHSVKKMNEHQQRCPRSLGNHKKWSCKICHRSFTEKIELEHHVKRHLCSVCTYYVADVAGHKERMHRCQICLMPNIQNLEKHQLKCKCEGCGNDFPSCKTVEGYREDDECFCVPCEK